MTQYFENENQVKNDIDFYFTQSFDNFIDKINNE
jgi:hypothetical protein